MYLIPLKTTLVEAFRRTFDDEYLDPDFRVVNIGIEYPIEKNFYPGIWIDYSDTEPLKRAGIDHTEFTHVTNAGDIPYTRFRFAGVMTLTIVALSSYERDRLYDEIVRVLAFGPEEVETNRFRHSIETSDLIAVNLDFDTFEPGANAAAPGTPWGTDEMIYERSLNVKLLGEFINDRETGLLVPLSAIKLFPKMNPTLPPTTINEEDLGVGVDDWH